MKLRLNAGLFAASVLPSLGCLNLVTTAIALSTMAGGVAAASAGPLRSSQIESMRAAAISQGADASSAQSLASAAAAAITRQIQLIPSDSAVSDDFGISVSLSGNRALIGADSRDGDPTNGKAYIFSSNGRTWTQEAELIPSDSAQNQFFGVSVSLSGTRALVGAEGDSAAGENVGAAYIFDLQGSNWVQTAKLIPVSNQTVGYFGHSVSLTGNRALVGAILSSRGKGKAYIYDFDGTTWSQTASLTAADLQQDDQFGRSVSLSGNRALIGTSLAQAAYVFLFDGTAWNLEAELTSADGSQYFGSAVSLSGTRALVGDSFGNNGSFYPGAAYVFAFDGSTWSQQAKLTASDGINLDAFGYSVSLVGKSALIGAIQFDSNGPGAAYLFVLDGANWNQQAKYSASNGSPSDLFGIAVSLSGKRSLIGATGQFPIDPGTAYILAGSRHSSDGVDGVSVGLDCFFGQ